MKTWPETTTAPAQEHSSSMSSPNSPTIIGVKKPLEDFQGSVLSEGHTQGYRMEGAPTTPCVGCMVGLQGCCLGSLWGLWGSQQDKTGPSALFKQHRRVWAEFPLQQTHREAEGWRRMTSSTWHLFSIPPQTLWKHSVASTSLQFHTVPLVFCLYQWSLLCFMHKIPPTKVKWKHCPSTRPCRKTSSSHFCSYPRGLPKFPSWDHQTQDTRTKAPKGSFLYQGEGEIYCLSASRNLLLPPAFGLLPTSLISNSLKSIFWHATPSMFPPQKNQMQKNLLFWA